MRHWHVATVSLHGDRAKAQRYVGLAKRALRRLQYRIAAGLAESDVAVFQLTEEVRVLCHVAGDVNVLRIFAEPSEAGEILRYIIGHQVYAPSTDENVFVIDDSTRQAIEDTLVAQNLHTFIDWTNGEDIQVAWRGPSSRYWRKSIIDGLSNEVLIKKLDGGEIIEREVSFPVTIYGAAAHGDDLVFITSDSGNVILCRALLFPSDFSDNSYEEITSIDATDHGTNPWFFDINGNNAIHLKHTASSVFEWQASVEDQSISKSSIYSIPSGSSDNESESDSEKLYWVFIGALGAGDVVSVIPSGDIVRSCGGNTRITTSDSSFSGSFSASGSDSVSDDEGTPVASSSGQNSGSADYSIHREFEEIFYVEPDPFGSVSFDSDCNAFNEDGSIANSDERHGDDEISGGMSYTSSLTVEGHTFSVTGSMTMSGTGAWYWDEDTITNFSHDISISMTHEGSVPKMASFTKDEAGNYVLNKIYACQFSISKTIAFSSGGTLNRTFGNSDMNTDSISGSEEISSGVGYTENISGNPSCPGDAYGEARFQVLSPGDSFDVVIGAPGHPSLSYEGRLTGDEFYEELFRGHGFTVSSGMRLEDFDTENFILGSASLSETVNGYDPPVVSSSQTKGSNFSSGTIPMAKDWDGTRLAQATASLDREARDDFNSRTDINYNVASRDLNGRATDITKTTKTTTTYDDTDTASFSLNIDGVSISSSHFSGSAGTQNSTVVENIHRFGHLDWGVDDTTTTSTDTGTPSHSDSGLSITSLDLRSTSGVVGKKEDSSYSFRFYLDGSLVETISTENIIADSSWTIDPLDYGTVIRVPSQFVASYQNIGGPTVVWGYNDGEQVDRYAYNGQSVGLSAITGFDDHPLIVWPTMTNRSE